jgi:hypothetical protein
MRACGTKHRSCRTAVSSLVQCMCWHLSTVVMAAGLRPQVRRVPDVPRRLDQVLLGGGARSGRGSSVPCRFRPTVHRGRASSRTYSFACPCWELACTLQLARRTRRVFCTGSQWAPASVENEHERDHKHEHKHDPLGQEGFASACMDMGVGVAWAWAWRGRASTCSSSSTVRIWCVPGMNGSALEIGQVVRRCSPHHYHSLLNVPVPGYTCNGHPFCCWLARWPAIHIRCRLSGA